MTTEAKPADLYFEDIVVGRVMTSREWTLTEPDIVAFARQWDPLPIHLDRAAAAASPFGGLTASGAHLLAIKQKLLHDFGFENTVICTLGFDDLKFLSPGRPGDRLRISLRWDDKRLSASKPGVGVARHHVTLLNQDGEAVLSHFDNILIRRREPG